jgi:hypothetical protein
MARVLRHRRKLRLMFHWTPLRQRTDETRRYERRAAVEEVNHREVLGGAGDRLLDVYEQLESESPPKPSAMDEVLERLRSTIVETEHEREARLAELRKIGTGPPAGENEILAELDELVPAGILLERTER